MISIRINATRSLAAAWQGAFILARITGELRMMINDVELTLPARVSTRDSAHGGDVITVEYIAPQAMDLESCTLWLGGNGFAGRRFGAGPRLTLAFGEKLLLHIFPEPEP